MGAGCSNGRALAVQDSVTKKITLTKEGKEHLKNFGNPQQNSVKDQSQIIGGGDLQHRQGDELNNSRASQMEKRMLSVSHGLLWEAVETNDYKAAEELLDQIALEQLQLSEADLFDTLGNSMAHKAASLGHAEILMLLLERTGAKPDIVNGQLATPLHLACKNNRESVAKFLIGCGVDVNGQDEHGQTPLLICCIHGNYELAQIIIESSQAGHTPEPLEIDLRDHRGLTPLNCAAIKGDIRFAKLLIEKAGANVEVASPKGCTPIIYASRGGYVELLEYLIVECKCSPLKQDNSGATLFHHAIEKANMNILEAILKLGRGDLISAIEIADNAGRTPIFEAVDNNVQPILFNLLLKKRAKKCVEGGFSAKVNVLNYNGQTPLFSAVREGNFDLVRMLIEEGGAESDLNAGEMVKDESEELQEEGCESIEEKNFMEAYKNCMTPLHLACILGLDDIAIYLIERAQANPNLQTNIKGYASLHLSVLANKPEMLIELLTRTNANPNLPDYSGQTFIEMVEKNIPDYLDHFTSLLENLQVERLKRAENDSANQLLVATHYYNPDDEREIKGLKDPEKDLEKHIEELQLQEQQEMNPDLIDENQTSSLKAISQKRFQEMDDSEIEVEDCLKNYERDIEAVFGRKIALALIAVNFKFKEMGMKIILKHAEKLLSPSTTSDGGFNIQDFVRACTIAVDLTCNQKVVKVFNLCLQLLTILITSAKVEQSVHAIEIFKRVFTERSITLKLLLRSEEGNTRLTNKIHECLLDYSFHPRIGEAHVSSFILQRINLHNKQSITGSKPPLAQADSRNNAQEGSLGSYKGLLAQLALLYKFVNSFGVSAKKRGPLNVNDIVNSILPSLSHQSQDVRSASTKILLDVQRLSGAVNEDKITQGVPEKQRGPLIEKLKAQVIEKEQNQAMNRTQDYGNESIGESQDEMVSARGMNSSRAHKPSDVETELQGQGQNIQNWTGAKDQSLKNVFDFLKDCKKQSQLSEDFMTNATVLLKSSLEENNLNLYIQAVEVASALFNKALFNDIVLGSLHSLIKPVVLRTTDTNTRLRKKSVELIYQVWTQQPPPALPSQKQGDSPQDSVPQIIADVICDSTLQERSIIGRLGLFIKRSQMIELADQELSKKPHQVILGRNYEELTEFASQWCQHKNTKVRQNAMKLIVEICRINSLDPRGQPFKQRIINLILMLRSSIRDPLIAKINEICTEYIDVNELELNLATKSSNKRAVSIDVNKNRGNSKTASDNMLPQIGAVGARNNREGIQNEGALPSLGNSTISLSAVQPQIVLPHSEPMSDEIKGKAANLIELFGQELIQCFYSQSWSNRQAAIEKLEEQLHNLDPNRRDAMSAEINRKNAPIEESFKIFLEFIDEGSKDPVLKNLIAIFDLLKKALPTFFRYIQPQTIKKDLMPVVSNLIKKTTDLKVKVREVAIDFCLYLSHQSPIGPEVMVNQVLSELEVVLSENPAQNSANVAANMGNSHMISSCFKLLNQFQQQSKILDKSLKTFAAQQSFFTRFMTLINSSLRHSNPQVRKEGETLFKVLYPEFGEKLDSMLNNQKPQVVTKLLQEAKQEAGMSEKEQQQELGLQRAQTQIRQEMISQSCLNQILKGQDEHLQSLRLPNAKKRLNAVVELRKAVQKELVSVQGQPQMARQLFEPLSLLIRQLLSDEEPDIYMETLNMLRAVVGALVPHMSALDVHLMLGSFLGVIVANTVSGNIRTQIASDKVIIFFAKHSNIGPFLVAKDILKNIEKCIKAVQFLTKKEEQIACIQDKKPTILRFLSILQLLLQHFSIILCYQVEFYDKCIELIADSLILLAQEDQGIKNICVQLIINLQKIDVKLLEQAISKLDFSRKTPLRKAMIELEHQSRAGKNVLTQDHHAFANQISQQSSASSGVPASPMNPREGTRGSMMGSSRTSLFSPGTTLRDASPITNNLGMTSQDWARKSQEGGFTPSHSQQYGGGMNSTSGSNGFKNAEGRAMRRMISLENENPRASQTGMSGVSPLQNQARQSVKVTNQEMLISQTPSQKRDLVLPEIVTPNQNQMMTPLGSTTNTALNQPQKLASLSGFNNTTAKMSLQATGGAGFNSGYTPTAISKQQSVNENTNQTGIRPPLYVPQKRDAGRAGTGMLNGTGIQGLSVGTSQQNSIPINPLNRTGPLPQSLTNNQAGVDVGGTQFKTDFNSNLYSGLPSSSTASSSAASSNLGGNRSHSLQKPLGSGIFKPQPPQAAATFETNVKQYKEADKRQRELF